MAVKSILFTLFTLLLLISCNSNDKSKNGEQKESTYSGNQDLKLEIDAFENFQKATPQLKLPLELICGEEFKTKFLEVPELVKKLGNEGYSLLGKLAQNKNYIAIIYIAAADVLLPIIKTTDLQGNKIDSLILYPGECGNSPVGYWTAKASISPELDIVLSDSNVSVRELVSLNHFIEKKKEVIFRKKIFRLDNSGYFIQKKD